MLYLALACCAADAITTYIGMRLFGTSIESNGVLERLAIRIGPIRACILWFCFEIAIVFLFAFAGLEVVPATMFGIAAVWNLLVILRALAVKRVKARKTEG
jgi:hypothetical protein